jgi:hypothetical protein
MQPVTKSEVEGIRGVSADSVIATLVDRRFLTEAGKRDTPGRPTLYKTTPEFLEAFGLRSLDELPPIDVDGAVPVELALPIPTALASALESSTTTQDVIADEPSADVTTQDAVAQEETAAAPETETEPEPSTA